MESMVLLYIWMWKNENGPGRWKAGVVVNLFEVGDKTDPGSCRVAIVLNVVVEVFYELLRDRIVLEKESRWGSSRISDATEVA